VREPPDPHGEPTYRPAPLRGRDLEVLVTPGLRLFPRAERDAVIIAEQALEDRLRPWNPLVAARVRRWVIGAALCLPLLTLLITPLRFRALPWVVPSCAAWGAGMALWRPGRLVSGFVLLGLGAGLTALGGHAPLPASPLFLVRVSALMTWFCVGFVLGVSTDLARSDGT
jgi:hypothetical protein